MGVDRRKAAVDFVAIFLGRDKHNWPVYELIKSRNLIAYPDATIRLAIQRAIAVETSRGWRIAKEKTSHKIDVVVALGMAALGAVQASGKSTFDDSYKWVGGPSCGEAQPFGRLAHNPFAGMNFIDH
jgi:hypothetical protein